MVQPTYADVRPSPIAGQWYPGDRERLARVIDRYLKNVPEQTLPGQLRAVIAPHAGYQYSGQTAAYAFRQMQGMAVDRVFIVSPMHHAYPHPILTTSHEAYQTPLGAIPVDHAALDALREHLTIRAISRDPEHSLEIELPFLQRILDGDFTLVPLMLRDQSYALAEQIGQAIAALSQAGGGNDLLVASSDLSHFYTQTQAEKLDHQILDRIAACDPAGVIRLEEEGKAFACGRAAIAAVMVAARELGADQARILKYATSADASGDTSRVVGYAAAALYSN